MFTYMFYVYIYKFIYIFTYIYINLYIETLIYICIRNYIHIDIYRHINTYIHTCITSRMMHADQLANVFRFEVVSEAGAARRHWTPRFSKVRTLNGPWRAPSEILTAAFLEDIAYPRTGTYICTYTYIYIYIYIYIYEYCFIYTYIYIYTYIDVCKHIYVCTYMHIYIHIKSSTISQTKIQIINVTSQRFHRHNIVTSNLNWRPNLRIKSNTRSQMKKNKKPPNGSTGIVY